MARVVTMLGTALVAWLLSAAANAASETWTTTPSNGPWGDGVYVRVGDFDGDGKADYASVVANTWYMRYSNGTNGFTFYLNENCLVAGHLADSHFVRVGDFDGDGKDEYASPSNGEIYVYSWPAGAASRGTACPTIHFPTVNNSWGQGDYVQVGDFNGDGYDDFASPSAGNAFMKFGGPGFSFTSATWTLSNQWGNPAYVKVGDFNGDGKADIISISGNTAYMKLSTGSGFTSTTWSISNILGQGAYTFAGDFNGDGYSDIASCNGGTCYLQLSTGFGFVDGGAISVDATWGSPCWVFAADFEGDGNTDISSAVGSSTVYMKLISP
jgi:FG-GAP-like repeat